MQTQALRLAGVVLVVAVTALAVAMPRTAQAARVAVLSNKFQNETAADFNARIGNHMFTAIDVGAKVPSLAALTADYDVVLLFEDNTFANATAVGNVVAAFARSGRAVVLGTFYDQDRSDGSPTYTPHGWGELEDLDPNTTDGTGTAYSSRTLDAATLVVHPLTEGVTSLFAARFAGGNQPKPGTRVVADWAQKNARGGADPAIAYRITEAACVIHIAIAPQYPSIGTANADWGGDFHRVWNNAFDFGAAHCTTAPGQAPATGGAIKIPTLSDALLALTALLLAAAAMFRLRARRR